MFEINITFGFKKNYMSIQPLEVSLKFFIVIMRARKLLPLTPTTDSRRCYLGETKKGQPHTQTTIAKKQQ